MNADILILDGSNMFVLDDTPKVATFLDLDPYIDVGIVTFLDSERLIAFATDTRTGNYYEKNIRA